MSGFSTTLPSAAGSNQTTRNNEIVSTLKASLPNLEDTLPRLFSLKFYALCPNEKRMPVEDICRVYETEPEGLVLRTFDDRLVLVIQAVFEGQTTPYWQQAFYLSTGQNSDMGGTWLVFDGIVMEGDFNKEISEGWGRGRPRKENEKLLLSTPWFSKEVFCGSGYYRLPPSSLREQIDGELLDTYGKLYLPEGDAVGYIKTHKFLREGYGTYYRFGTISYALASYKIGGNEFSTPNYGEVLETKTPEVIQSQLQDYMRNPSPLQACFLEMAKTYPLSKPNVVNAYLDKHKALSYMNAFRAQNIFPPGLSFISVPMKSLGYSMPLKDYASALSKYVRDIWKSYHLGNLTLEQVREKFTLSPEQLATVLESIQETCVMPTDPGIEFNLNPTAYASNPNKLRPYYGGKKTKRRRAAKKRKNRKTRKQ